MIRIKIYERMALAGYHTRQELSRATGIHPNSLGKLVAGNFRAIRLETLDRLCGVFRCQVGDLLEFVPEGEGQG